VLNEEGEPMLTEVNPRYTGSVEVVELLCGTTLFEDHCRACGYEPPNPRDVHAVAVPSEAVVGKMVLYSDRDVIAPPASSWQATTPRKPIPGFADLPREGSLIRQGGPICSILLATRSTRTCRSQLLKSAKRVYEALSRCPTP
jgi:uncharacterized protein